MDSQIKLDKPIDVLINDELIRLDTKTLTPFLDTIHENKNNAL